MKKIATALLTLLTINSMVALSVTGTSGAAFAAEVSTGAETTEAMETAEVTETTEAMETAEATETVDVIETAEVTETAEAIETAEATETAEVMETAEVTETAEAVETEEVTETAEAMDPSEVTQATGAVENAAVVVADEPVDTAADSGVTVVELNSGAERNGEFITVNDEFQTQSGKLTLIMSGLKERNKEPLLNALGQYFDANGEKGVKVVDAAFPDAEKWDTNEEERESYDSVQCWAASASNMLWESGWAKRFVNPATGADFSSEDDVFGLFNTSFTNRGGDVSRGIDWFFMGEFYMNNLGSHANLIDETVPSGGFMKSFVSTMAQHRFAMAEDGGYISQLERIDASGDSPAVFQLSLGSMDESGLTSSVHSVTLAGVIIDPQASKLEDRYKGIAIINSDDDAVPGAQAQQITDPTFAQKQADKAARPNSCTFYPLQYVYDANGKLCWKLAGYSHSDSSFLCALNALELPSNETISKYTETEGNCSVADTIDLTMESIITTDAEEAIVDYFYFKMRGDEKVCTEFVSGEPVNLNYFVINRSGVIMDENYTEGKDLSVGWKVTKDSDGSVAAQGMSSFGKSVYSRSEMGGMIHLNQQDDGFSKWEAGDYTVTVSLNPDRAIKEAYYLNNFDQSVKFTIIDSEEDTPQDNPPEEDASKDDIPQDNTPQDNPSGNDSGKPASEDTSGKNEKKNLEISESAEGSETSKTSEVSNNTGEGANTGDAASEYGKHSLLMLIFSAAGLLTVLWRRAADHRK